MRGAAALAATLVVLVVGCDRPADPRTRVFVAAGAVSPGATSPDDDTVRGQADLVREVPARGADGVVHAVVEIPAGTNAKFEVSERDGVLRWERQRGARRVVDYLPYPASYGFVPGTRSDPTAGGDGDPLDVFVLGPAVPRGEVVAVRVVAVLRLLDEGEVDDKLLAVPAGAAHGAPFARVRGLADLRGDYPGVLEILETWLESYDGSGVTELRGVEDEEAALRVVDDGVAAFHRHR